MRILGCDSTPRKTFRSVTHYEIALGQTRLTLELFVGGLPEKKVYLGGMSILSILLSLEPGCHTPLLPTPLILSLVHLLSEICIDLHPHLVIPLGSQLANSLK
jgi:hypothetical protein